MADRIVLNTISYHGHGAIENIVPELPFLAMFVPFQDSIFLQNCKY